tara:strand:+ start:1245 stop:1826 length:582 start_codon:yes stop_codon:yes gene_type:complete
MSDKMKVIMEHWGRFVVEEKVDKEQLADVITRLKDMEDAEITAGDLKFLINMLGKDIASGNKVGKEIIDAAADAGIGLAADAAGIGILTSGAKLVANVAKRAKIKVQSNADVMASLMFVDDTAATQNPVLNILNINDAYEGSINPLLNGPFVNFAFEDLGGKSDDEKLPKDYGTILMKQFLEEERSLKTEPTR